MNCRANTSVSSSNFRVLVASSFSTRRRPIPFRDENGPNLARHHLCLRFLCNYCAKRVRSPSHSVSVLLHCFNLPLIHTIYNSARQSDSVTEEQEAVAQALALQQAAEADNTELALAQEQGAL
jgi:hypothetical protein